MKSVKTPEVQGVAEQEKGLQVLLRATLRSKTRPVRAPMCTGVGAASAGFLAKNGNTEGGNLMT